jgi:gliding motility-associated-like protein
MITRCECPIWVSNAFAPNGDDKNELFMPQLDCNPTKYEFKIYDRWGELIFETSEINQGWNGLFKNVEVAAGSYTWLLTVDYMTDRKKKEIQKSGSVLLVR